MHTARADRSSPGTPQCLGAAEYRQAPVSGNYNAPVPTKPAAAKVTAVRPLVVDTGQGRTFLFVVVETDAGVRGVGEGSQNDQDAAVAANVRQLAPQYVGRDPLDLIEARARPLMGLRTGRAIQVASSAIEQALWDVAGKLLGVPVYKLLGGRASAGLVRLRCYATMSAGLKDRSPAGYGQEAARCAAAGYTGVKVVPFGGASVGPGTLGAPGAHGLDGATARPAMEEGVARVAAVREAVGPDVDVLIELGFGLDWSATVQFARRIEPYNAFWIEAPLLWDDAQELARLRQAIPQRVASGEQLHGRRAFRDLIEQHAVDVLQPDVKWTGGIYEAKKVAAWAETYQVALAPHNNSGPVATAASAHVAATLPNFIILETPSRAPEWLEDATGPSLVEDGHVSLDRLASRPGLGIDLDESKLSKWLVDV
jgi:galactonate dehydratase